MNERLAALLDEIERRDALALVENRIERVLEDRDACTSALAAANDQIETLVGGLRPVRRIVFDVHRALDIAFGTAANGAAEGTAAYMLGEQMAALQRVLDEVDELLDVQTEPEPYHPVLDDDVTDALDAFARLGAA